MKTELNTRIDFVIPPSSTQISSPKYPMTSIVFDDSGYLPDITHELSLDQFIDAFCDPATTIGPHNSATNRHTFTAPFSKLHAWAFESGATSLIIGGSFITNKATPTDLDVLVLFPSKHDIKTPTLAVGPTDGSVDMQCLSEDEPELLQAYMQLIGADRRYIGRGLVQIKLHQRVKSLVREENSSSMLPAATLSYIHRHKFQRTTNERLVVPIHGIRSDAGWIPKFTFLASTSNWAVAPFVYGYESGLILGDESRKAQVVDEFRLFLGEIRKTYHGSISIVAHSFGTYIVGRYLKTAGHLVEPLGGVVLAGSILNTAYDWTSVLDDEIVNMVLNTRSSNDEWVKMLPDGGFKHLASDPLMGHAAVDGFIPTHSRLKERNSSLLKHSNMFESDVITRLWLPFLDLAERLTPLRARQNF